MVARALTPDQVNELVEAVRQLQLENQVLKARLDSSRGAGGRIDKLCEFSGKEDDFADWSFKVKCHLSLMDEGSVAALEWAEGCMDEITLGTVRAKTVEKVASMEELGKTLFRVVGTKVKGEALDIAKSVERDSGFELWRRLVRRYDPRTTGQRVVLLSDIIRTQELQTSELLRGIDKWSELVRKYETTSGETLGDSVKMTVLQNMCPKEVRTHLQLNARRLLCAQDVREEVLAYVNAQQTSVDPKPMEVDGVHGKSQSAENAWSADDVGAVHQWGAPRKPYVNQGAGKGQSRWDETWRWPAQGTGKGAKKGAPGKGQWAGCFLCGGDHFARDCKGGGKSGQPATGCFVCGGPHFARECRERSQKKGKKGVSEVEQREGDVGGVQYVGVNEVGTSDGGWCAVTMDSGAAVSVMPAWWYPREQKRTGVEYTVANGAKIADMGEKLLKFEFDDGGNGSMKFRLANVTKPLGAISSVCDRGNRVVFDSEGSYVDLQSSGKRIPLRRQNGVYVMDVWVGGSKAKPGKRFRRQAWRP